MITKEITTEEVAVIGIEVKLSSKEQMVIEMLRQKINNIRLNKSDNARATDTLAALDKELDKLNILLCKFAPSFEEELTNVANTLFDIKPKEPKVIGKIELGE